MLYVYQLLARNRNQAHLAIYCGRVVKALEGEWAITWTRFDASHQRQVIGHGEEVWKLGPGGIPFIEENRSTVNGEPENDYAAVWWDDKAKKMHGLWCHPTINDEGCSSFDTRLEGNDVVMTGEWEQKGKRLAWREVCRRVSPTEMTSTLLRRLSGRRIKVRE